MIAPIQNGVAIRLRSVREMDAGFILSLRSAPEYARYLHATSPSLKEQREWVARQKARSGDYYFVIEPLKEQRPVGLIGLYHCSGVSGEFGRWICPFSSVWALESALLIYRFAFSLSLKNVYSHVMEQNTRSLNFYRKFGALETGPKLIEGFMQFTEEMTQELFLELEPRNQARFFALMKEKAQQRRGM